MNITIIIPDFTLAAILSVLRETDQLSRMLPEWNKSRELRLKEKEFQLEEKEEN